MENGETPTRVGAPKKKIFNVEIPGPKTAEDELLGPQIQKPAVEAPIRHESERTMPEHSSRYDQTQKKKGTPGRKNKTEPWVHKNFNISKRHAQLLENIIVHARKNDDTRYNERKAIEAGIELLAKVRNLEIPPVVVVT